MGCWTEWRTDGSSEAMYGDLDLAPAGSTPLDCEAFTEPADPADEPAVQEDDPTFDCRTMGNLVCGAGAEVAGVAVPAGDYSDGDRVAAPVGACLAELGYSGGPVVRGDAERCAAVDAPRETPAAVVSDSPVQEDEAGFDCRTSGNRTCGPGNADGVAAGCYVGGELAAVWTDAMYGQWLNCGPVTRADVEKQAKLDGLVAQVCGPNRQGGVTCTWAE